MVFVHLEAAGETHRTNVYVAKGKQCNAFMLISFPLTSQENAWRFGTKWPSLRHKMSRVWVGVCLVAP
eukprot:scaffold635574_cov18-Prasinocladus_malaysianus.AAC.1